MSSRRGISLALSCLLGLSGPASALTIDYALRATGADEFDGPRDLGLAGGTSNNLGIFNLAPRLQIEFNPKLVGYLRGRAFLPTRKVEPIDNGLPAAQRQVKRFAALDEFWLEYKGLTNYPGESLRLGRQLIRQHEGTWIAQDVDSLRYLFDTTLLTADVGAIRQFSTYRTDNEPVFGPQRDRLYGFINVDGDWLAENRVGFRLLYAADQKPIPNPGTLDDAASAKRQDVSLTWLGLHADNGYFAPTRAGSVAYRADFSYVTGQDTRAPRVPFGPHIYIGRPKQQYVGAFETGGHLRWQPFRFPAMVGASYMYSSGGGSQQYEQSGLQGNAAYFTGTPSLISLYNEALRAEQGNLQAVNVFVSLNLPNDDASLIFSNFRKVNRRAPIVTDNVNADTNTGEDASHNVGNGVDLVLTHYYDFGLNVGGLLGSAEATREGQRFVGRERSSFRLRASLFDPGSAYGQGTRCQYRVLAEATLWVN